MDTERNTALGQFLRARRALVRPEQVGLVTRGRRQVAGLRRDEVARLAGLSARHYARLEQGQQRPSKQTVVRLGPALRLDEAAMAELRRLARPVVDRRPPARVERVAPHVLALLNDWTAAPAYILGWGHKVLARNALAAALHRPFTHDDNMLRMIFLDPAGRAFFQDWTATARAAVHELRQAAQQAPDDRALRELVGELSIGSQEFRRLWAEHEPRAAITHRARLCHPDVGELHLRIETFPVTSAPGQRLIAQPAEPGSRSAETLALLSTLAA